MENRLKTLRKEKKITQKELAALLNLDPSSISKYESMNASPSPEILLKLASYFGVSTDYLLGNEKQANQSPYKKGIKIPVLGYVAAGYPIFADENIIDYEEIPEEMAKCNDYFGLVINGNSMEPRIWKDDVVIVRKQTDVESGSIAIILVNGDEATCKKVIKYKEGINLVSLNPNYDPMFFTNQQVNDLPVKIIGLVVEIRGKLKGI